MTSNEYEALKSRIVSTPWKTKLHAAILELLNTEEIKITIAPGHLASTPVRVINAYEEYLSGYDQDPKAILSTALYPIKRNSGMVIVQDITVNSLCQHHIIPFFGRCWFAYIPDKHIVGLSKIPRLVDCFAHRLQVQEDLCDQIIEAFESIVKPVGCGIVMEATHLCMCIRGIKRHGATTRTHTFSGTLLHNPSAKQEFLEAIK